MDVVDRLDFRIALHRDRVEARHVAHLHERGLQGASVCIVVAGRMCSSLARIVRPLTSLTGTTEFLKRPSSQALAARFWLSTA